MGCDGQAILLEIPEQPVVERTPDEGGKPKLKAINRDQTMLAQIWVDELIGAEHKARAIWELADRLNLSRFEEPLKTRQGAAGRAAWDPRLLVSVWVYAYSEGISSAREIERLMEWEPGLQWLSGLDKVNHHTLSDFRVEHREALDELFVQMLSLLQSEGLLSLERVMHDGTKIRAQAGADTFRREKTLREHLEEARQVVASMGIRGPKHRSGTEGKQPGSGPRGSARAARSGPKRVGGSDGGGAQPRREIGSEGKPDGAGSAAHEARR